MSNERKRHVERLQQMRSMALGEAKEAERSARFADEKYGCGSGDSFRQDVDAFVRDADAIDAAIAAMDMPETEAELLAACEAEARRVWGEGVAVFTDKSDCNVFVGFGSSGGVPLDLYWPSQSDLHTALRALLAALREL